MKCLTLNMQWKIDMEIADDVTKKFLRMDYSEQKVYFNLDANSLGIDSARLYKSPRCSHIIEVRFKNLEDETLYRLMGGFKENDWFIFKSPNAKNKY